MYRTPQPNQLIRSSASIYWRKTVAGSRRAVRTWDVLVLYLHAFRWGPAHVGECQGMDVSCSCPATWHQRRGRGHVAAAGKSGRGGASEQAAGGRARRQRAHGRAEADADARAPPGAHRLGLARFSGRAVWWVRPCHLAQRPGLCGGSRCATGAEQSRVVGNRNVTGTDQHFAGCV